MKRFLTSRWAKALMFALCLAPLALLGLRGLNQKLGANPIEFITHATGEWTVRLLLITLTITPPKVEWIRAGACRAAAGGRARASFPNSLRVSMRTLPSGDNTLP